MSIFSRFILILVLVVHVTPVAVSAQGAKQYSEPSMIVEVEGKACLGQTRSREETMKLAVAEAKRMASEMALTHISSDTQVKNGVLVQDIVDAYSKGTVRIIEELEKGWLESDASEGFVDDCFGVTVKAEVIPAKIDTQKLASGSSGLTNPNAPLVIELWTDKDSYTPGDTMKFYFRGNKPFYAKGIYSDAGGKFIEATAYNRPRYYKGGTVYEIPEPDDDFILAISPPFGQEKLTLYASTQPIVGYSGTETDTCFIVDSGRRGMSITTRGLIVLKRTGADEESLAVVEPEKAEFAEAVVEVKVEQ